MLHEVMGWPGPMTHRQYRTTLWWLRQQMNIPSRSDHYAMQTALTIQRQWMSSPGSILLDDFKIKFGGPKQERELTEEELAERARKSEATWLGIFGVTTAEVAHLGPGESIQFDVRPPLLNVVA